MTLTCDVRRALATLTATTAVVATLAAAAWRPTESDVRVHCPLTVGGSFEIRTTALGGTLTPAAGSPALTGQLTVDLRTLDSGVDLRTDHLRNRYLEVGKGEGYDTAVISDVALAKGDASAFEGKSSFTGTLQLHGVRKPVTGDVEVRKGRVVAAFPVTLTDFEIEKPRYLGIGVRDQVRVKVAFTLAASS